MTRPHSRRHILPRGVRAGPILFLALALVLVIALATLTLGLRPTLVPLPLGVSAPPTPPALGGTIALTSDPPMATVDLDGRKLGTTPIRTGVPSGEHTLTFRHDGYIPSTYSLFVEKGHTTTVAAVLWLAKPTLERVRPIYPGAMVRSASFLADGTLALAVALPGSGVASGEELWAVDGSGRARRMGPPRASGPIVASPGGTVAYLAEGRGIGQGSGQGRQGGPTRLDEVWLEGARGAEPRRVYQLPSEADTYQLGDLSFEPDGKHLLIVSREGVAGGAGRTHFVSLDLASGTADEVLAIPSEVLRGSLSWSADGSHAAFLARADGASGSALCLLDVSSGDFRDLADLGPLGQGLFPLVPLAWSPDGRRFVYSTPLDSTPLDGGSESSPLSLFGGRAPLVLARGDVKEGRTEPPGSAEAGFPVWMPDGELLGLAGPRGEGPLVIRSVDSSGKTSDVGEIPAVRGRYEVLWDVSHAQALLVVSAVSAVGRSTDPSASPELWLVHFRAEAPTAAQAEATAEVGR